MSKKVDFSELWSKAYAAGLEAGNKAVPVPMVVSEADGLSDQPKPGGQSWYVADGVCGFAWVNVKPGNSALANWLKKNGKARGKSYYGGVDVWVGEFGQSMARKEAMAAAMAGKFREAGFKAYMMSRMD